MIDPNAAKRRLRAYSRACPSIDSLACQTKIVPTIKTILAIQIKIIPMIKAIIIPKFPIKDSPLIIALVIIKDALNQAGIKIYKRYMIGGFVFGIYITKI